MVQKEWVDSECMDWTLQITAAADSGFVRIEPCVYNQLPSEHAFDEFFKMPNSPAWAQPTLNGYPRLLIPFSDSQEQILGHLIPTECPQLAKELSNTLMNVSLQLEIIARAIDPAA